MDTKNLCGFEAKLKVTAIRARYQTTHLVDENGMYTEKYPDDPVWWCRGFFGGMMAMMYAYTKDEEYLATLRETEKTLDAALRNNAAKLHHDVGFMYHTTAGADYRLTGNVDAKNLNLQAAAVLSSRFILGGNFIRVWNNPKYGMSTENFIIIDSMLNLPLLYWASDVIGDDRFKRIAVAHADSTLVHHIRPDGSVIHIVVHDRETGECVKTFGGQGAFDGSSWSRGQAWALYGTSARYPTDGDMKAANANTSIIFGEYYYVEALLKLMGSEFNPW